MIVDLLSMMCPGAPLCEGETPSVNLIPSVKKILDLGETMQAGTPNTISIADGLMCPGWGQNMSIFVGL